jgi:hypothetical protein
MIEFKQFLEEASMQTVELSTIHAKKYKPELEKLGHTVTTADDEGLVIKTKDMKGLHKWMLKNGWDKEDIKAMK